MRKARRSQRAACVLADHRRAIFGNQMVSALMPSDS
jgi:hypothetical protein